MNGQWFKRRWYEFRVGYGLYVSFFVGLWNFILLTFTLFLNEVPLLKLLFPNLIFFGVFCVFIGVPLSVLVGHWHNRNQLHTETMIQAETNIYYKQILDDLETIKKKLDI